MRRSDAWRNHCRRRRDLDVWAQTSELERDNALQALLTRCREAAGFEDRKLPKLIETLLRHEGDFRVIAQEQSGRKYGMPEPEKPPRKSEPLKSRREAAERVPLAVRKGYPLAEVIR